MMGTKPPLKMDVLIVLFTPTFKEMLEIKLIKPFLFLFVSAALSNWTVFLGGFLWRYVPGAGERDVSLLSADQALIVSGSDHSFPSAGSPDPHTWPHGHGPENHPRPAQRSIGSQLGRVATGSESVTPELWGVTTQPPVS